MAWYGIDHSCGHHDRVQLYGKTSGREQEVERREKSLCSDCWKAEQERRNTEAAKAAEVANPGLPTLTGSPAQITWAGAIRAKAIDVIAQAVADADQEVTAFAKRVLKQSESRYWIDRRDSFGSAYSARSYLSRRVAEEKAKAAGKQALGLAS